MGVSKKVDEMDSSGVYSGNWVIGGIEVTSPLKPIFTKSSMERSGGEEAEYSTTPTSSESRIPSRLACPPAPKKPKPPSSKYHYRRIREFFSPPDLETVFIRRVESA